VLELIEAQAGEHVGEDDIVRFDDVGGNDLGEPGNFQARREM